MKPIFIKILCWVLGIGAVGYVGLTIANSFPQISGIVGRVPIINKIPTPIIDQAAQSSLMDGCKADYGEDKEIEVVRISDAPESEGSYHRWECVVKNPNKSEEEYQEYLNWFYEYTRWPQADDFDYRTYRDFECQYYDGMSYLWKYNIWDDYSGDRNYLCIHKYGRAGYYEGMLERYESDKRNYIIYDVKDYSKD